MTRQATVSLINGTWKFAAAALLGSLFVIISSKPAHALWNIFPDVTNYGMNDAVAVVARDGGGWTLTSEEAFFKVFSPRSSLTITVEYICNSYNWGNSEAQIQWWANSANEQAIDANPSTPFVDPLGAFDTASCGASDNFTTPTISGSSLSTILSHEAFYTYTLAVIHTGGAGGINGFRVTTYSPGDYVTFREQTLAESTTSGAYPGYRAFAVLDQEITINGSAEDSYTFVFGTDCSITTDVQAFLRWSDADFGISNEQGNVISFTLFDVTDGTSITRSGAQLMDTVGLNNDDKEFQFTAKPNHKYRWVWNNVDNRNGVQVWMPFSEINFVQACPNTPPPTGGSSCSGQPFAFTGGPGGCSVTIPGVSYGANQICTATVVSQVNGTVSASCGGSTLTSTSSSATATGTVSYSIQTCPTYNPFTGLCPGGYVSSGSSTASGSVQPCAWGYAHNSTLTPFDDSNPTSNTVPKPNEVVRVNVNMYNDVGNQYAGAGPNHQVCIEPYSGTQYLVNNGVPSGPNAGGCFTAGVAVVCRGGSIPSNGFASPVSYFGSWQIRPDAPHGSIICFSIESTPRFGPSYPAVAVSDGGINATPLGARCFSVYNLRFDLSPPTISTPSPIVFPGQTVTSTITICNDDDELNAINEASLAAGRGTAASVPLSTAGSSLPTTLSASVIDIDSANVHTIYPFGPCNLSVTGTSVVPINVPVGQEVCIVVTAARNTGYSDNSGLAGSTSGSSCVLIVDSPYMKVYGNDTWAGGHYELGTACGPVPGTGTTTGDIRGRSLNTFGSTTNYVGAVEQYAAFARGNINAFGTAEVSASGSGYDSLAFANINSPQLGQFGYSRPLSNIFDCGGGASGAIDDLLWSSADAIDPPGTINSMVNNNSTTGTGQFAYSAGANGNINGGSTITRSKTILVDGPVTINSDLVTSTNFGSPLSPDIPILVIVTTGDITINGSVNRLDGIFISLGTIHTCPPQDLTINIPCNQPLEINGAFISNNIAFRRTAGGIAGASTRDPAHTNRCTYNALLTPGVALPGSGVSTASPNNFDLPCSGEIFRFNPDLYIGQPIFHRGVNDIFPIQQIRELPPIF